jgi:hypothetical protein
MKYHHADKISSQFIFWLPIPIADLYPEMKVVLKLAARMFNIVLVCITKLIAIC